MPRCFRCAYATAHREPRPRLDDLPPPCRPASTSGSPSPSGWRRRATARDGIRRRRSRRGADVGLRLEVDGELDGSPAPGTRVATGDGLGAVAPGARVRIRLLLAGARPCRTSCAPSTRTGWLALDGRSGAAARTRAAVEPAAASAASAAAAAASPAADAAALIERRDASLRRGAGALLRRPAAHRARLARAPGRHRRPRLPRHGEQRHPARTRAPELADAVARQLRRLNTNSRFNYGAVVEFSERLASLLPDPLDTVFLVNSGSEAADLALRVALAATGRRDVVSVARGVSRVDVRLRRREHLDRRQPERPRDPTRLGARRRRAELVPRAAPRRGCRALRARGRRPHPRTRRMPARRRPRSSPRPSSATPAASRCPTATSPRSTRPCASRAASRSPTRCRPATAASGDWFWGFEQQGVVPDIVAVAKAMGNGYPLGAVITTPRDRGTVPHAGVLLLVHGREPRIERRGPRGARRVPRANGCSENAAEVGAHLKSPAAGARHAASAHRSRARPRALPRRRVRARPRHPRAGDRGDRGRSAIGCSSSASSCSRPATTRTC